MVTCNKNFTLIELLVVLSIMFILMGLLIPVLNNVKEIQERTICQNNIKNHYMAFASYASINNGRLPVGESEKKGLDGKYGSMNYGCYVNLASGHTKYGYMALMQPVRKWRSGNYWEISAFNGVYDDLESLACPSDEKGIYGERFSEERFPNVKMRIGYSYRGIRREHLPNQGGNFYWGNYNGATYLHGDVKPIISDKAVSSDPVAHGDNFNLGYSDGHIRNYDDSENLIKGSSNGVWNRNYVWAQFDQLEK